VTGLELARRPWPDGHIRIPTQCTSRSPVKRVHDHRPQNRDRRPAWRCGPRVVSPVTGRARSASLVGTLAARRSRRHGRVRGAQTLPFSSFSDVGSPVPALRFPGSIAGTSGVISLRVDGARCRCASPVSVAMPRRFSVSRRVDGAAATLRLGTHTSRTSGARSSTTVASTSIVWSSPRRYERQRHGRSPPGNHPRRRRRDGQGPSTRTRHRARVKDDDRSRHPFWLVVRTEPQRRAGRSSTSGAGRGPIKLVNARHGVGHPDHAAPSARSTCAWTPPLLVWILIPRRSRLPRPSLSACA